MAAYLLKRRTATTQFEWVRGHSGNLGNEECDKLAKAGAEKDEADELILEVPDKFDLQGAKLSTITQAIAYRGIRNSKTPPKRTSTERNLNTTKIALSEYNKTRETTRNIWKNMRNQAIRPKIQQFLYKATHEAFKIGPYWANIPDHEHRQRCPMCNTTETMTHILIECNATPVRTIWDLAQAHWPHARELWPNPSLGIILGCGSLALPDTPADRQRRDEIDRRLTKRGPNRLLQILISESAHLIWSSDAKGRYS